MGIQINGNTDTISAIDGGLTVSGASLGSASASSLNISGIVTASGFSGNVTGTVNSSGVSTFSGGVIVAAGSTSAPSISPSGDSNTGIFFPSADTVVIGEGGIEALRVDSSGRVGINSNSPNDFQVDISAPSDRPPLRIYRQRNTSGGVLFDIRSDVGGTNTREFVFASGGDLTLSTGNLVIGTAGKGIDFSAAGNAGGMSSELLDDYEEGTWTPTLTNFSSGSPSYQYQEGHYTKIGRYVIAQGIMGITNSNTLGSGTIQINLPFTAGSTTYGQAGPVADGSGFTSFNQFGTMVGNSASVGQFVTIGTSATGISYNQPSATWYVRFCFMYHTV